MLQLKCEKPGVGTCIEELLHAFCASAHCYTGQASKAKAMIWVDSTAGRSVLADLLVLASNLSSVNLVFT